MPAPKEVLELVEKFQRNREVYENPHFNETETRIQLINPFFKALGWDVDNVAGYAEAYKDVIHEDAVKVGRATKAPDYSFRIGGARKFFLEAKKPAINIKEDASPAYQVRRYAWSAKLPISVVSNFAELAIYDCRDRPDISDKVSKNRIQYWTVDEYVEKWDEINSIFSKESVLKGSFDKYAVTSRNKRGTAEVDSEFLKEIEDWRELLARNIAIRNPAITQRRLNYAVQQIIDRIIFLRICEDRGIEPYGRLKALQTGSNTYSHLIKLFHEADDRYNSGIFHFREEEGRKTPHDDFTPTLNIDDKTLKDIFKRLYYPDSPYEFSVLSADILGQVYEQFLGKVIRLTAGGQAKVEDKPEVKKAGGVFYTPKYIVDYIVKETVGKLLESKTVKTLKRLSVLDPACGSGSFLLGAYQFLLDWHLQKYIEEGVEHHSRGKRPKIFKFNQSDYRLTTVERKRILVEHIYGVDIDPQAVEVTKLSLALKVLEEESAENLNKNREFFHERALPDLDGNIKCGNSLIGSDFWEGKFNFDDDERYRINAFDWKTEFESVYAVGGFDAIIGNPPWGAALTEPELAYLRQVNQRVIVRMIDSFMYFVHQSSKSLQKVGEFGMILPDVVLYQADNEKLRTYILENFQLQKIINLGNVFEGVTRPSCILVFKGGAHKDGHVEVGDYSSLSKPEKMARLQSSDHFDKYPIKNISKVPGNLFISKGLDGYLIWEKVNKIAGKTLLEIVDEDGIQRGVSPDLKEAFLVDTKTATDFKLEKHKLKKVLVGGRNVKRYIIEHPDLKLIYTNRDDDFKALPNIRKYIDQFKEKITCREVLDGKHPIYSLHRPRDEKIFLKTQKLIGVITEDEIVVALDEEKTFATDGLYLFAVKKQFDIKFLMGVLNSRLFIFLYRLLALETGRAMAQVKPTVLGSLPIRVIDSKESVEVEEHSKMIKLVEQIISFKAQLNRALISNEKTMLQRQIDSTAIQIDRLVYRLYGLTEDEIIYVENATK